MTDTYIADFHTILYILEIKNLAFHLLHICILGTNNCGKIHQKVFKYHRENQDVLCHCDYDEIVVASFSHQTKYEYYGINRSVSIESIVLEHFGVPAQTYTATIPHTRTFHAVFH